MEQIDKQKIADAVKVILEAVGENPDREGLIDTPMRVARMYEEVFAGLKKILLFISILFLKNNMKN